MLCWQPHNCTHALNPCFSRSPPRFQKFNAVEAEYYASLNKQIAAAKHTPAGPFKALLKKVYKRQK